jgi:hypothetical protein
MLILHNIFIIGCQEYNPLEYFLREVLFGAGIFMALMSVIGVILYYWYIYCKEKKKKD